LAKNKRTIGAEVSEEVVNAFEAGIVFGRMVESRRPKRHPLWSEEEWLQALIKAVGKKAESKVREIAGLNGDGQQHDG
jgi:sugar (pentulose or hexulose) kinase